MIGEGVFAFLATQSAVNQLTGTRIVPDMSPKNMDYPRLVYTRISTTRPKVLQGLVGVATARYQIDAWGLTPRHRRPWPMPSARRCKPGRTIQPAALGQHVHRERHH